MVWTHNVKVLVVSAGLFGGAPLCERAVGQVINQDWLDRFPASGGSGLIDEAVGIMASGDFLYVAGTKRLSSTNSVIVLLRYDFDGVLIDSVEWPPNPTSKLRMARRMAIRTGGSPEVTTIAIVGEQENTGSSRIDAITLAFADVTGSGDPPQLVDMAVFYNGVDDNRDRFARGVSISPNGALIGVVVEAHYPTRSDLDICSVVYDANMDVVMNTKFLDNAGGETEDYAADIVMEDSLFYVTGTSVGGTTGILTAEFVASNSSPAPVWDTYTTVASGACFARALARMYEGSFSQPVAPPVVVVVGSALIDGDRDFLTVSLDPFDGDERWRDQHEIGDFDEEAVSAAAFDVDTPTDEVPAGLYFYVTGTAESDGNGTDVFTKLYRDLVTSAEDRWEEGARWDHPTDHDDDAAVQVIVTHLDNTDPTSPLGPTGTRALVGGWSTDGADVRFVTVKYDAVDQPTGNKVRVWFRVENNTTFEDFCAGITYRMRNTGEGTRLWFFLTGRSDAGTSSVEDMWTLGFEQEDEGP